MVEKCWIRSGFGKRVRELRNMKGWSQMELSDRADLHRTYIADIERGARNVSIVNVGKIADAFGVSLSELMTGVRPMIKES